MSAAEALTPMADLAGRWGVTSNTVSRRLAFLGIKPIRQGNYRFLTPEQLALAEALQQHILSGRPMESFARPDQPEGGQVVRQVKPSPQVVPQVTAEQVAALFAQIRPVDPLQRARNLAEAADLAVPLSSAELAAVLGLSASTIGGWSDGHTPRPGFVLRRTRAGSSVWWTIQREGASSRAALPAARPVGFAPEVIEARVSVLSPGALMFDRNRIG